MPAKVTPPTDAELKAILGRAAEVWDEILRAIEERHSPLERLWKPSKMPFGQMCLLQHKKRTLLYMTPDKGKVWIAVVLGDRAAGLAAASDLPAGIKTLIAEARPYAEGRGIRFPVSLAADVPVVAKLAAIKVAPE